MALQLVGMSFLLVRPSGCENAARRAFLLKQSAFFFRFAEDLGRIVDPLELFFEEDDNLMFISHHRVLTAKMCLFFFRPLFVHPNNRNSWLVKTYTTFRNKPKIWATWRSTDCQPHQSSWILLAISRQNLPFTRLTTRRDRRRRYGTSP